MAEKFVTKYRCGNCSKLHEDEDDADECCKPDVVEVLVCAGCEYECEDKKRADAHVCDKSDPERCLCGTSLTFAEIESSEILGSQKWCAACQELILQGVPAPRAQEQNFLKRIGAA